MKLIILWFCLVSLIVLPVQAKFKQNVQPVKDSVLSEKTDKKKMEVGVRDIFSLLIQGNLTFRADTLKQQISKSEVRSAEYQNPFTFEGEVSQNSTKNKKSSAGSDFTDTKTDTYSGWISKKDDLGIVYSTTVSNTTTEEINSTTNEKDLSSLNAIKMQVDIPIFKDWGEINILSIKEAKTNSVMTQNDSNANRNQLFQTVGELYWDLVGLLENKSVLNETIAISKQIVKEDVIRLKLGEIKDSVLKQSKLRLLNHEQDLLNILFNIRDAEEELMTHIGFNKSQHEFVPKGQPEIHQLDWQKENLLEKVYQRSTELIQLSKEATINQYELESNRNEDKLDLDLNVSYAISDSDTTSKYSTNTNVGLSWKIPLGENQSTEENIQQSLLNHQIIQIKMNAVKQELKSDLNSQLRAHTLVLQNIKTAQYASELAQEVYQQEIKSYKVGESTTLEISEAQNDFLETKYKETQFFIEYEKVFQKLLISTGQFSKYYLTGK